jgi:hypothetical protein
VNVTLARTRSIQSVQYVLHPRSRYTMSVKKTTFSCAAFSHFEFVVRAIPKNTPGNDTKFVPVLFYFMACPVWHSVK